MAQQPGNSTEDPLGSNHLTQQVYIKSEPELYYNEQSEQPSFDLTRSVTSENLDDILVKTEPTIDYGVSAGQNSSQQPDKGINTESSEGSDGSEELPQIIIDGYTMVPIVPIGTDLTKMNPQHLNTKSTIYFSQIKVNGHVLPPLRPDITNEHSTVVEGVRRNPVRQCADSSFREENFFQNLKLDISKIPEMTFNQCKNVKIKIKTK